MTIRVRMAVLFLSIFSILLLVFSLVIYFESEVYRQREYKIRLRQEALTAATIIFNKNEISPDLLKLLDKHNVTALNQEEIIIYDIHDKVIYESGSDTLLVNREVLGKIRQEKDLFWEENGKEMYGTVITNSGKEYIVLASSIDKYGIDKQKNLAFILGFSAFLLVCISAVTGWLFARRMLRPVKQMIQKIDKIQASALNLRLNEGNKADELEQLSIRFNQMLDRLEHAFQTQRSFVSHASHELRTPLTAITGQIQVSLLANDNQADLKLMIQSVLEDVQQLNKLTNNLLDLTSIDADDTKFKYELVNILELIWQVRAELLKKNPNYQILISLDEEADSMPEVRGNDGLLYTALINLIENGAKFSPQNTVEVKIKMQNEKLTIDFHNEGSVIPANELNQIFEPFKRGSNSRHTKGHGVGLSLTRRIVQLHKGKIDVKSSDESGTTFTLILPR
ncbi:integral membrane sensor signal transduction histidine kinase [Emticicia oligotrophica DSM 17448]|uniref:histidine kinase n=1 Tax=Emticicia oligotrophica (strain DSM 17448 / CIP 109782 / MTCC 6937 / GPTSA100-15) TaxID=929562 RepID=A0ABN4AIL5_EMTOG|nr:HAMP domain-containing sensor histidine kinase [Emticicia oligotrophica]AFK01935.1 integral membrane sensor signal transduction histidine kinase [Emticicia oligotrophica DSM 17448]